MDKLEKDFNLIISFQIDIVEPFNILKISTVLTQYSQSLLMMYDEKNTYATLLDNMIKDIQFIELLSYQYFVEEKIDKKHESYFEFMSNIHFTKEDGKISADEFKHILDDFKDKVSLNTLNALLFYTHLQIVFQFVKNEMEHAEYRLKETSSLMFNLLYNKKGELEINIDKKAHSQDVDAIGYAIEDTIKAMVSALDGMSKLLNLFKSIKNRPKKVHVPNVLHDKLINYRGFKNNNPYINLLEEKYKELKLIISLRNDITHNKSFHAIRQTTFIGQKTPSVNNYNLAYTDVLMWDYKKNNYFKTSYEFSNFYTEENNIVPFLHNSFKMVYEIFTDSIKIMKHDIIYLCKSNSKLDTSNLATEFTYQEFISDSNKFNISHVLILDSLNKQKFNYSDIS
jgi:hypothetical protein